MKNIFYLLSFIVVLSSCFKEEDPRTPNAMELESMVIGEDYGNQIFFKLSDASIVSSNNWTIWDLKFYAQEDKLFVKLNDAANMKAYRTNTNDFESITSFNDDWTTYIDAPDGNENNLALNLNFENIHSDTLFTHKDVFVLMLGTDAAGVELGYKKLVIDYFYNNHYHIRFANLDGTEEHEAIVTKDETLNYVYFSFQNEGEEVVVEPDKETWDLIFTRSTDMTITNDFSDTIFDYSVTAVLLNPFTNEAYRVKDDNYDNFNSSNVTNSNFSNQLNAIGYDWKSYDLENSVYAIRKDNYYILKDGNSVVYKMNFLSFVDETTNLRGTISFEYNAIK